MQNPLTFVVESSLGAFFISLSAIFCIALLYISITNFNSDVEILSSDQNRVIGNARFITPSEKILINTWANENGVKAPSGRSFYKYMLEKYPEKPWLLVIE